MTKNTLTTVPRVSTPVSCGFPSISAPFVEHFTTFAAWKSLILGLCGSRAYQVITGGTAVSGEKVGFSYSGVDGINFITMILNVGDSKRFEEVLDYPDRS